MRASAGAALKPRAPRADNAGMGRYLMTACLTALLVLGATPAAAALWSHVDAHGVAHFASKPQGPHWRPVIGSGADDAQRVPGKADDPGRLLTWLQIAPQVHRVMPWVREAAGRYGVDAELIMALIAVESGFNAAAVSPAGALGLMQITPPTAERYARGAEQAQPVHERLLDARTNIHTGARMLADLSARLPRVDLVLAAWNAGEGAVRRAGGRVPDNGETPAHVHMVLELYWALLQQRHAEGATRLRMAPP